MENLFAILILASLILLIIGFVSPQKSLFWYKKERTKKKSATIYLIALFASFILFGITSTDSNSGKKSTDNTTANSDETSTTEQENSESAGVQIGQVLKTEYFDIVVNKASIESKVSTGNEFADLEAEQGNKYLIINATFKNTDTESRMLMEGSVWISANGKEYEFDKAETIMLEGWGLLLDQINPMVSKTTNLVYKIPADLKGTASWQPGRSDSDERIILGNIE